MNALVQNAMAPTERPRATVAAGVAPARSSAGTTSAAPSDHRFMPARTPAEQRTGRGECVVCGERLRLESHRVLVVARPSADAEVCWRFRTPHHVCAVEHWSDAGYGEEIVLRVIDVCRESEQALLLDVCREEIGWPDAVLEVGYDEAKRRAA